MMDSYIYKCAKALNDKGCRNSLQAERFMFIQLLVSLSLPPNSRHSKTLKGKISPSFMPWLLVMVPGDILYT